MVIETFVQGPGPVYARAAAGGRRLPPGLAYVDSWVDAHRLDRCFQLMETEDPALFEAWIAEWRDLVDFEVVPVVGSAEAAARARAEVESPPAAAPEGRRGRPEGSDAERARAARRREDRPHPGFRHPPAAGGEGARREGEGP
jgi:hypothetical protein